MLKVKNNDNNSQIMVFVNTFQKYFARKPAKLIWTRPHPIYINIVWPEPISPENMQVLHVLKHSIPKMNLVAFREKVFHIYSYSCNPVDLINKYYKMDGYNSITDFYFKPVYVKPSHDEAEFLYFLTGRKIIEYNIRGPVYILDIDLAVKIDRLYSKDTEYYVPFKPQFLTYYYDSLPKIVEQLAPFFHLKYDPIIENNRTIYVAVKIKG